MTGVREGGQGGQVRPGETAPVAPPGAPPGTPLGRPRGRRRSRVGCGLLGHLALYAATIALLLVINLATTPLEPWFLFPAWGWGILLAGHAGFVLARRRWLGLHAAVWVVANLGLAAISVVFGGHAWFLWPLGVSGVFLLAHAGIALTAPTPAGPAAPPPAVALGSGRRGPRGWTMRIAGWSLIAFAVASGVGAAGVGVAEALSIEGSGRVVREERDVADFRAVDVGGEGRLVVSQGESPSVSVVADDNLEELVRTRVEDGTLKIDTSSGWWRDLQPTELRYEVTVRDPTAIEISGRVSAVATGLRADDLDLELSGAGELRVEGLEAGALRVDLSGAGSVRVAGRVDRQEVAISGAGQYRALGLTSRAATVDLSGTGEASVHATETLDATVSGVGRVEYAGDPEVRQDVSGIGEVEPVGDGSSRGS